MTYVGNWSYPTSIKFGAGRVQELAQACEIAGITRPLLVTDRGLAALSVTQTTLDIMDAAGLGRAMFADVDPNPNEANLIAGVAQYKAGAHDGVIAFGGGSGLDLGKMVAFMSGQTRPLWDFEDIGDWWTRADPKGIAPIVAIPTTAGTGSEVGRASVITNSQTQEKKIIFHPKVLPSVVICDPELTVGMPQFITAGTGLDAFAHCVEAFCSPHYHPMSQGIALEGMRLVKTFLPRAYADGSDLEARAHMMSAAAMGATAFQKGLGVVHSLAHPLSQMLDTHHGLANAVNLPYGMEFNLPGFEDRFEAMANAFGLKNGNGTQLIDELFKLNERLGLPTRLSGIDVKEEHLEPLADLAFADFCHPNNPKPVSRNEFLALYKKAL